jgi:hypothetical protein
MVTERNMDNIKNVSKAAKRRKRPLSIWKTTKANVKNRPRTSDEEVIIRMNKECNNLVHYAHVEEQSSFDFLISAYQ